MQSVRREIVHHMQARRPGWMEPDCLVAIAFWKIIEFRAGKGPQDPAVRMPCCEEGPDEDRGV